VKDQETLESVAKKYGVPTELLIRHNFKTIDPAEINWYLREHVGCRLPTADGKNWRFSNTANPGLIYLPLSATAVKPTPVAPLNLTAPGSPEIVASEKFSHNFKIPDKAAADLGYLLAQANITVEGEIIKVQGGTIKRSFKKDQIKLAIEKKFDDDFKAVFAVKADQKSLENIATEVQKNSKEGFARALIAPFEASLKQSYRFGHCAVVPEIGAEFSATPVIVRLAGEYEDVMMAEGVSFRGKINFKVGFNVGLSKQGWAWVGQRVGAPALRAFTAAGRTLAGLWEYLVAEGIVAGAGIAAAALAGTFLLTALTAWVVNNAKRKGELQGLATWYGSAYLAKVLLEERPSGFIIGDAQLRDKLVELGEQDALATAREVMRKLGRAGSDREALEAYRSVLFQEHKTYENIRYKVRQQLEEKSRQLVGL